ncbi:hypothetical protein B0H19DRAFT_1066673 [Mycena capillaripes]|nr:hypothetical protein B0H19DRAFT_1066673 [Mycena capillaripes]
MCDVTESTPPKPVGASIGATGGRHLASLGVTGVTFTEPLSCPRVVSHSAYSGYSSGMFSGAQNFTVTGHNLTNTTNYYAAVPSDVRMVPLSHIDLQQEICLENSTGLVNRHRIQRSVRRIYSAKIGGQTTTVAMYQGCGAEEEWRQDLAKYMSIRQVCHPNILQICGAASSGSIRATLFHDSEPLFHSNILSGTLTLELDLIPFKQYVDFFRHSHFHTIYFYACCSRYIDSLKNEEFSVRKLVVVVQISTIWSQEITKYFHSNFQRKLTADNCTFWIRRSTGQLCADLADPTIISWLYDFGSKANTQRVSSWNAPNMEAMIIENLTLRKLSRNITLTLRCFLDFSEHESWLTQANYIFSCLQMTSNFEDFVFLYCVDFEVQILPTTDEPPTGFLFLCPEKDFQIGPSSFCWPDLPAYWSLDPSGVERLSAEEATDFGFPALELTTEISGSSWDNSFDPESQDVARHLDLPLYCPCNEMDAPFAHVDEEEDFSGEDEEDQTDADEDDENGKEDDQMNVEDDEDKMDLS